MKYVIVTKIDVYGPFASEYEAMEWGNQYLGNLEWAPRAMIHPKDSFYVY